MKQWLRISLGALLATGFVLSAVYFRRPPDPVVDGRTASAWAADLLSPEYALRGDAQAALKRLGEEAVPQLRLLIRKRNPPWETQLVRLNSTFPFLNYQRVDAAACRLRGAEMLGLLGPTAASAIPDLVNALAFDAASPEADRALARVGNQSVTALAAALEKSRSPIIRERSARLLREFGAVDLPVIRSLMRGSRDPEPAVREQSILTLGFTARRQELVVATLLDRAKDESERVRAAALKSLGDVGLAHPEILAAVESSLVDVSSSVRLEGAKSLWILKKDSRSTVPVLTKILLGHERRWEAAYALGDIGPQAAPAVPALIKVLEQEQVARPFRTPPSAAFALGKIGRAAIPGLTKLLAHRDSRVRSSALLAIGFMGSAGNEALPPVLEMLHDTDPEVRHTAALTLPTIGASRDQVLAGLEDCLRDEDIYIRSAAAAQLRQIAPEKDWALQPE